MSEQPTGKIVELGGSIFKKGLLRFFDRTVGDSNGEEDRPGRLRAWWQNQVAEVKKIPPAALAEALEDPDVKEQGAEFVSQTVQESVEGIRQNFDSTLSTVKEQLKPASPDTRSNYQRMKDILKNDDDPWYMKIGKNALARVVAWSLPVASYISAAVASRISSKDSSEDLKGYRSNFQEIYSNLVSRLSPKAEATQA